MPATPAHSAPRGREGVILFSIAFATFMVNVDSYIVNISLPTISAYFRADTAAVSWVVMSYQLTVTGLLLVFGTLGDRIGIKRLFMAGYALFTFSSVLCALAPTLGWLVAGRSLQGIGASVLYALTPAMVPKFLPPELRGAAFGTLATVAALGITLGTPLGGLITGLLSWHWAFLINLPIGIAAMLVCRKVLPDDQTSQAGNRLPTFDYPGALLSFTGLLALIIMLSRLNSEGARSPLVITTLAIFLVSSIAFVFWERQTPNPLLDYTLFRNRSFNLGNLANFLGLSFLAGHNFIIPFYLTVIKKMPPQQAGSVFLLYSLVYMGVGPLAGRLTKFISPRTLCTAALGLGVAVALGFSFLLRSDGMLPVYAYFVGMALVMATFIPANNTFVMGLAPDGKQGAVSGSFRMIGRIGMTFGICLFQALFTWAAAQGGPMHLDTLQGVERLQLLHSFSTVYLAGALLFVIGTIASLMARGVKRTYPVVLPEKSL